MRLFAQFYVYCDIYITEAVLSFVLRLLRWKRHFVESPVSFFHGVQCGDIRVGD